MSYNGWKNRATWAINLWFNPESKSDVAYIKDLFEEKLAEIADKDPWLADLVDDDIDWAAIEKNLPDEDEDHE